MIISVNWLRKYLGQKVDIDQLTERIGSRLVEITGYCQGGRLCATSRQ